MLKKNMRMLLLLLTGIISLGACRSIPAKIEDNKLAGLSDTEAQNLEGLKTRVVTAKHHKDIQAGNEALEKYRLNLNHKALHELKNDSEKAFREKEIAVSENHLEIEKKKSAVASLELSIAIATLEAQKARIVAAQSKYIINPEEYENELKRLADALSAEKNNLVELEKRRIK